MKFTKSKDGIDRATVRVEIRLTHEEIVTLLKYCSFGTKVLTNKELRNELSWRLRDKITEMLDDHYDALNND